MTRKLNVSFMLVILQAILRIRGAERRNVPWAGWYGWPLGHAIGTHCYDTYCHQRGIPGNGDTHYHPCKELQALIDKGFVSVNMFHDGITPTEKFDSLASQILDETYPEDMNDEEFERWNASETNLGYGVNTLPDTQVDPSEPFSYWEFDDTNRLVRRSFEPNPCPCCGDYNCDGPSNCD